MHPKTQLNDTYQNANICTTNKVNSQSLAANQRLPAIQRSRKISPMVRRKKIIRNNLKLTQMLEIAYMDMKIVTAVFYMFRKLNRNMEIFKKP